MCPAAKTGPAAFTGPLADTARVTRLLGEARYCVNIRGNQVEVTRYEGEVGYHAEVQQTFAKLAKNYPVLGREASLFLPDRVFIHFDRLARGIRKRQQQDQDDH